VDYGLFSRKSNIPSKKQKEGVLKVVIYDGIANPAERKENYYSKMNLLHVLESFEIE
jgi:hypothetical protein